MFMIVYVKMRTERLYEAIEKTAAPEVMKYR